MYTLFPRIQHMMICLNWMTLFHMLPLSEYSSLLKALMTPYLEIVLTPNIINVHVVPQNTTYDNQLKLKDLIPRVIFEWITIASKDRHSISPTADKRSCLIVETSRLAESLDRENWQVIARLRMARHVDHLEGVEEGVQVLPVAHQKLGEAF